MSGVRIGILKLSGISIDPNELIPGDTETFLQAQFKRSVLFLPVMPDLIRHPVA